MGLCNRQASNYILMWTSSCRHFDRPGKLPAAKRRQMQGMLDANGLLSEISSIVQFMYVQSNCEYCREMSNEMLASFDLDFGLALNLVADDWYHMNWAHSLKKAT